VVVVLKLTFEVRWVGDLLDTQVRGGWGMSICLLFTFEVGDEYDRSRT
jgi:hypothetical protein